MAAAVVAAVAEAAAAVVAAVAAAAAAAAAGAMAARPADGREGRWLWRVYGGQLNLITWIFSDIRHMLSNESYGRSL